MESKDSARAIDVSHSYADADAKDFTTGAESQEKHQHTRESEGDKQQDRSDSGGTSDSGGDIEKRGAAAPAPGKESTLRIPGVGAGAGAGARLEVEVKGSDMNIVAHAIEFCESESFQNALNDFKIAHIDAFSSLADSKTPDEEEQTLEQMAVFTQYSELLDDLLSEQFIAKNGYTQEQFYYQCKDVVDGKFTAMFDEHEHLWFVQMLQGWMEYPHFVRQMCDLATARRVHLAAMAGQGGGMIGRRRQR